MPTPRTVFVSYAHADQGVAPHDWLDRLATYLRQYERAGLRVWHDRHIPVGAEWRAEIEQALSEADAAILLVGPTFLGSEFILDAELPSLFSSAREHGVRLYPVITRACAYGDGPLAELQAFNDPGAPLETLDSAEQDRILNDLAREVATGKRATRRPLGGRVVPRGPDGPYPPAPRPIPVRALGWTLGGLGVAALALWQGGLFAKGPDPAYVERVTLEATELASGAATRATVRLREPAAEPLTLRVSADPPGALEVPEEVAVPRGARDIDFEVVGGVVGRPDEATLEVRIGKSAREAAVALRPALPEMVVLWDFWPPRDEFSEQVVVGTFEAVEGVLPAGREREFLTLERLTFAKRLDDDHPLFDVELALTNVLGEPLVLAIDDRFFTLEDASGGRAEPVYFAAPRRGATLAPGESAVVRLVFLTAPGWIGKHGPSTATLRVEGLETVRRATWDVRLPKTAD